MVVDVLQRLKRVMIGGNITFKEELERIFIPGHTYRRVNSSFKDDDFVFDDFKSVRQCSVTCRGEIGKCDGTRLRFIDYAFIICPYSGGKLQFEIVNRLEKSNERW